MWNMFVIEAQFFSNGKFTNIALLSKCAFPEVIIMGSALQS